MDGNEMEETNGDSIIGFEIKRASILDIVTGRTHHKRIIRKIVSHFPTIQNDQVKNFKLGAGQNTCDNLLPH